MRRIYIKWYWAFYGRSRVARKWLNTIENIKWPIEYWISWPLAMVETDPTTRNMFVDESTEPTNGTSILERENGIRRTHTFWMHYIWIGNRILLPAHHTNPVPLIPRIVNIIYRNTNSKSEWHINRPKSSSIISYKCGPFASKVRRSPCNQLARKTLAEKKTLSNVCLCGVTGAPPVGARVHGCVGRPGPWFNIEILYINELRTKSKVCVHFG